MKWNELDLDKRKWTLPRNRAKNNRKHEVHFSDAAIQILPSLPRTSIESTERDLVFTVTGTTAVSGFGNAKRRLDALMLATKCTELGGKADALPHWTLHDLRRTAATGMARLNFPPHVVDKVLNHVSGTIRGIAAVYNRFEYLAERRAALEAWGQHISDLVAPPSAKIIPIRA